MMIFIVIIVEIILVIIVMIIVVAVVVVVGRDIRCCSQQTHSPICAASSAYELGYPNPLPMHSGPAAKIFGVSVYFATPGREGLHGRIARDYPRQGRPRAQRDCGGVRPGLSERALGSSRRPRASALSLRIGPCSRARSHLVSTNDKHRCLFQR